MYRRPERRGKLAGMLLVDKNGVFDHVSRNCLLHTMEGIDADSDLMRWTDSFMSNKSVGLVIDGH